VASLGMNENQEGTVAVQHSSIDLEGWDRGFQKGRALYAARGTCVNGPHVSWQPLAAQSRAAAPALIGKQCRRRSGQR
jgi:hypothetical protein